VGEEIAPKGADDPGCFIDDDGTPYLVFGVWDFYIGRLNEDMISFAETPRKITIHNPESHYGKGKTDDKPYLHKRDSIYYLSWGCYYGMSVNIYGPYDCRGSIVLTQNVEEPHRYPNRHIGSDRHGSFFEWKGQWYYIFNDSSQTGNMFFRDSSICYLHYRPNGEMEPVRLTSQGVTLP
jgi:beta-xylosidase